MKTAGHTLQNDVKILSRLDETFILHNVEVLGE
jgi:hypothetical protein